MRLLCNLSTIYTKNIRSPGRYLNEKPPNYEAGFCVIWGLRRGVNSTLVWNVAQSRFIGFGATYRYHFGLLGPWRRNRYFVLKRRWLTTNLHRITSQTDQKWWTRFVNHDTTKEMPWYLLLNQRGHEVNKALFCGKEELKLAKELTSYPAVVHIDYPAHACVEHVACTGGHWKTFGTALGAPVCSLSLCITRACACDTVQEWCVCPLETSLCSCVLSFSLLTLGVSKRQEDIQRASFIPVMN